MNVKAWHLLPTVPITVSNQGQQINALGLKEPVVCRDHSISPWEYLWNSVWQPLPGQADFIIIGMIWEQTQGDGHFFSSREMKLCLPRGTPPQFCMGAMLQRDLAKHPSLPCRCHRCHLCSTTQFPPLQRNMLRKDREMYFKEWNCRKRWDPITWEQSRETSGLHLTWVVQTNLNEYTGSKKARGENQPSFTQPSQYKRLVLKHALKALSVLEVNYWILKEAAKAQKLNMAVHLHVQFKEKILKKSNFKKNNLKQVRFLAKLIQRTFALLSAALVSKDNVLFPFWKIFGLTFVYNVLLEFTKIFAA